MPLPLSPNYILRCFFCSLLFGVSRGRPLKPSTFAGYRVDRVGTGFAGGWGAALTFPP